jgi:hypothetical protein
VTSEAVELFKIETKELDGSVYINLTQTVEKLGGSISYDKVSGNAYISMNIIKVNGAFAGLNYGDFDKVDFLAVKGAQKLEYECSEDSAKIRIFDKEIMKLKKKNVLSVNVDNITAALGGYKSICSQYRVVDLKLPTFLRLDNQYFETNSIDGRLMLSAEAAFEIHEKTGWAAEALSLQNRDEAEDIDLDAFLEDYDYTPNIFSTVIDIKLKGN